MKARRRRRREDEAFVKESTSLASTDSNVIIGKLVLFSKTLPSKYEDWEASTKALLDKESLIGGGTIRSVYRTSFEGHPSNHYRLRQYQLLLLGHNLKCMAQSEDANIALENTE
ncbi:hypothetical protein FXO38_04581 [Capsicum annuum]|nr:hypothetical protein FXO38_04581 [Capsicum annuum]